MYEIDSSIFCVLKSSWKCVWPSKVVVWQVNPFVIIKKSDSSVYRTLGKNVYNTSLNLPFYRLTLILLRSHNISNFLKSIPLNWQVSTYLKDREIESEKRTKLFEIQIAIRFTFVHPWLPYFGYFRVLFYYWRHGAEICKTQSLISVYLI